MPRCPNCGYRFGRTSARQGQQTHPRRSLDRRLVPYRPHWRDRWLEGDWLRRAPGEAPEETDDDEF